MATSRRPRPGPTNPKPAAKAGAERPEPPLAEKLDRLKAEYEDADRAFFAFYRGSTIPEENLAKAAEIQPDFPAVVRRIADLAATAPKDPAVRDAMLWVIRQASAADDGRMPASSPWRRTGSSGTSATTPTRCGWASSSTTGRTAYRDNLLLGFYASAKGRESKGLARLALAQYLERKAMLAEGARKVEGRPTYIHDDLVRADGTLYTEKEVMPDEEYAYLLHLKQCDVDYLRAEAERLYEEVIAEYGDVPYITARDRMLEALLKQPEPKWNGEPLTDEDRRRIEAADRPPPLDARPGRRGPARRLAQPGRRQAGARDQGGRRPRQALDAVGLPRQGRGAGLLGHLVRPLHAGDPPREGPGRADERPAVRHARRQHRRRCRRPPAR